MSARTYATLAALAAAVLISPASAGSGLDSGPDLGLDFPKLSAELRERCGGSSEVDEALAQGFQHTPLGVFDVYFPSYALEEYGELHQKALQSLIDTQRVWLELFGDGDGTERGLELLEELTEWNEARERTPEPPASAAELGELFAGDGALGFAPVGEQRARIVLAPDRRDFARCVAFFGEADPNLRGLYWHDGVKVWTEFWWNDLQVVAIEYPPVAGDGDDPGDGIPMDFREPTGLEQHVAQRGAMALVWFTFGDGLTPAMELGLAQLLVVEAYDENNVRSGGSMRGSETAAFSAFVPGGNPSGGFLPPINADSGWRADKGKDHFVKALRAAQKSASKKAPHDDRKGGKHEKIAWFMLRTGDGSHAVRAPFLGRITEGKQQPPDAFSSDYMEFFRAYKTAFLHWLRTKGAGSEKKSVEAFRELATRVAQAEGKGDWEALAREVYGMPFSELDGAVDSLEWEFLTWLSKQR